MKELYPVAGISKQALHQSNRQWLQSQADEQKLFEKAHEIRKEHPGVGCRKMALQLRLQGWGRDKIEHVLLENGYRLKRRRRYMKTTTRQQLYRFPNLIEGLELNGMNQVIQTDITYYPVKSRFYYLTFIIDVYSRRITGFAVSKTLEAEANIRALKMMLRLRKSDSLAGLIHHSDHGSQYIEKRYLELLNKNHIRISMCDYAWQNPYAERINQTIKDEYLYKWKINNYPMLKKTVSRAVKHYNTKRTHKELNEMSPINFENKYWQTTATNRPKMKLYGS